MLLDLGAQGFFHGPAVVLFDVGELVDDDHQFFALFRGQALGVGHALYQGRQGVLVADGQLQAGAEVPVRAQSHLGPQPLKPGKKLEQPVRIGLEGLGRQARHGAGERAQVGVCVQIDVGAGGAVAL